jgi:hypothetical protein
LRKSNNYFALSAFIVEAESAIIVEAESVVIVVVSVDIVAVESTEVSSVLGLLWQAAKVSMLPTNRSVSTFFIRYDCVYVSTQIYLFLELCNFIDLTSQERLYSIQKI